MQVVAVHTSSFSQPRCIPSEILAVPLHGDISPHQEEAATEGEHRQYWHAAFACFMKKLTEPCIPKSRPNRAMGALTVPSLAELINNWQDDCDIVRRSKLLNNDFIYPLK